MEKVPDKFDYSEPLENTLKSHKLVWMERESEAMANKKVSAVLLQQGKNFCSSTTLHGFSYIGEAGRPWWERYYD